VVQVYDGKEKVVFYLSNRMLDTETRYHEIEKLSLFVLHLHKVATYPALCEDNRYLQIERHQAYADSSCVERPTREVNVCTVRI
jgi:hypothetical protein